MIKILVVDDEKGITNFLKSFFQTRGFYINTAGSGEEALEAVKKDKPNIIFLDIRMKGMDGLTALEQIKKIDSSIRIIMLTIIDDKEIKEKAMKLGADEYITKPFSVEHLADILVKKIQELLNEKHKE